MYTNDMPRVQRERPVTAGDRVRRVLGILADQNGPVISASTLELADAADTTRFEVSRVIARLGRADILRRDDAGLLTVLKRDALDS